MSSVYTVLNSTTLESNMSDEECQQAPFFGWGGMTSIETLLLGQGIRSLKPGLLSYNKVRQDGEHRVAGDALEPPHSDPAQPDADIMRVARQAPAAVTRRLVGELKAEGQEKGQDAFD